jgi:DNA-binding XRE family transcriptional regulator
VTIKDLRIMNNMSQRDFAKMVGVSQTAVYKWEKEEVKLSDENIQTIDRIFGLNRGIKKATSFDLGV